MEGFKLIDSLEQKFWLGKDLMQFIVSSKNFDNGLTINYIINVIRRVPCGFYIFIGERLKDVTLNFTNQCKK